MGLITREYEFTLAIPPQRLFKAFVTDSYNLIPKVLAGIVKNVDNINGDGSKPGDLQRLIFFQEERSDNVKRIDVVDQDRLFYAYTLLEGDFKLNSSGEIEKIGYEYKLEEFPDIGFTIIKNTVNYHIINGLVKMKDYNFDHDREKASGLFGLIESYLKKNPDLYN